MGILHESKLNKNSFFLFGHKSTWKISEAYLEPLQTSKTELFAKIVNGFKLLTVFAKSSILEVCSGSKYASGYNYL